MLIDRFLPQFQFIESHEIFIDAPMEIIMLTLKELDPFDDKISNCFMTLRKLPNQFLSLFSKRAPKPFSFENFNQLGANQQELVFGLIGKFWQLDFGIVPIQSPEEYLTFSTPNIAKLALNFHIQKQTDKTSILSTQTRVFCPDAKSLRKFTPYWYLIRLISGLMRQRTLKKIKQQAELKQ